MQSCNIRILTLYHDMNNLSTAFLNKNFYIFWYISTNNYKYLNINYYVTIQSIFRFVYIYKLFKKALIFIIEHIMPVNTLVCGAVSFGLFYANTKGNINPRLRQNGAIGGTFIQCSLVFVTKEIQC